MTWKTYFLAACLWSVLDATGQSKVTLYLNEQFELTTAENSTTKRETSMDIREMILDGQYKDYSKDGILIGEGSYTKGKRSGIHKTYKGETLQSSIEYTTDKGFTIWEFIDQNGKPTLTGGSGNFSLPYSHIETLYRLKKSQEGTLTGKFSKGERTGKWKYQSNDGKLNYEEIYDNGELVKRTVIADGRASDFNYTLEADPSPRDKQVEEFSFDQKSFKSLWLYFDAYPIEQTDSIQRQIVYPGGISKLMSLLARNIKYPAADRRIMIEGQVITSLTVDEHGEVKNIKILKSVSPTIDEEALRVIDLFKDKLCPAMINGKAYRSNLSIPLRFQLSVTPHK